VAWAQAGGGLGLALRRTRRGFLCFNEEDKPLCKKPPGFGKFSGEIHNSTSFVSFDALNLVKDF
jgi:hypothetical protein